MKNSAKYLIIKLIKVCSYIFPLSLFKILSKRFDQIYSIWFTIEFKHIGKNFSISYPFYLHGGKYITIGDNFNAGERIRIEAFDEHRKCMFNPKIQIGNNVSFYTDCHLGAINEIIIGDNVLIASKVFITDHFHGEASTEAIQIPPYERKLVSRGIVKIENNVWIGEGVVILPGVTIGENSIIGANSVVTKDIPRNSIVIGSPAKIIRTL